MKTETTGVLFQPVGWELHAKLIITLFYEQGYGMGNFIRASFNSLIRKAFDGNLNVRTSRYKNMLNDQ